MKPSIMPVAPRRLSLRAVALASLTSLLLAGLGAPGFLAGPAQGQPAEGAEGGMCYAPVSPKIEVLAARLSKAGAKGSAKVVEAFRAENAGGFPLVEDSLVTFVYVGRVALRACVPSDLNGWDNKAHEMSRLGESELYYRTLKLPAAARIDYKFYVDNAWMLDPLNPRTVKGGFGDNSAFAMPAYVEPAEIAPADSAKRGRIAEHDFTSTVLNNTRKVRVYLPAGFVPSQSKGGPPAVFVQDGGEYLSLASMANVLDNLIARGDIPPVVGVFIDPVDRNYEYYLNATYARMVVEEVVPFIRKTYGVAAEPARTAIMGASLGGEISLMIAVSHPEVFGKCASQSGAFEIEGNQLVANVKRASRKTLDVYLDCGTFEHLLDSNRAMRDALAGKGYRLKYQEFDEGHSWGNWRARIDDILVFFWGSQSR